MNGLGITIVIIALLLFTAKWVYNWRAGRLLMRKVREDNAANSVNSYLSSLQARGKEEKKKAATYYKSRVNPYWTETYIAPITVGSDPGREVKADKFRVTGAQLTEKIKAGLEKAERRSKGHIGEPTKYGVGYNMGKIAKEYGLSQEELKEALRKAELIVMGKAPKK